MKYLPVRLLAQSVVVVWWLTATTTTLLAEETLESARMVLRQAGLHEAHHRWICRDEARLLRLIDRVDVLEDDCRRANRAWRSLGDEQHRVRVRLEESNTTIERLDEEITALASDALRRQRLEAQQAKLRRRLTQDRQDLHRRLDGLHERSELNEAARRFANLHVQTLAHRIALQKNLAATTTWYSTVDQGARRAISALQAESGVEARLGPIKDYAHLIPLSRNRLQTALETGSVPIYREGGRFQVPVILNEAVPVTMGVADELDISVGAVSLLVQANIDFDDHQIRREVTLGDHRTAGVVVLVARLRVGSLVLRDVEFLAVDAGGEGDGPLLASSLFDDQRVVWDYERLEFREARQ